MDELVGRLANQLWAEGFCIIINDCFRWGFMNDEMVFHEVGFVTRASLESAARQGAHDQFLRTVATLSYDKKCETLGVSSIVAH